MDAGIATCKERNVAATGRTRSSRNRHRTRAARFARTTVDSNVPPNITGACIQRESATRAIGTSGTASGKSSVPALTTASTNRDGN
jgi:hypothetical protein